MKKWMCCFGVMGLFSQAIWAALPSTVALYTNVMAGTVTLSSNVSVTNAPTANLNGTVAGVVYNGGVGNGALVGSGDLAVYNVADGAGGGARTLSAVDGYYMDLASYTGDITVLNDRSAFTNTSSSAYARAYASGFGGAITNAGDIKITVTAVGGTDISTTGNAYADASANGVDSNIYGDFGGTINATAIGGNATGFYSGNAGASAEGLNGDIRGNMTGTINVSATGGVAIATATTSYPRPNAYASAEGCNSDIAGDLTGTINATAVGGTASSYYEGNAHASAYGVDGSVDGNLTGTINLTSIGGTATGLTSSASAFARAQAVTEVEGVMSGDIDVDSIGGTAVSTGGTAYAYAEAYGIRNKAGGEVSGTIDVSATGGSAIGATSADADADAVGIEDDFTGDFSGTITAGATGGSATAPAATAAATARGISGGTLIISNFTGNISATAVAGTESAGVSAAAAPLADALAIAIAPPPSIVTNLASANAAAIYASDYLYLNARTGSIHAAVYAPSGYSADDLADGSAAYAILSGSGDDIVRLGNMDIIGDVDLGGGANEVYVFGTTRIQGDLSATGGQNNYSFELYEDENNPLNPKLIVGRLFAGTNSTIAAYAAEGQIAKEIVGNSYEVIAGEEIDGTFVENAASLFDLAILQSATNVMITATGLKGQDVSGNSVARAMVQSALFVINDLSAHSGGIRSLLRGEGAAPEGPAGPEAEKLADGEWAVYARQFNDLGSQDSEGALAGYDWQTSGFMLGAERLLNPNLVLGAAAGGAWTDLDGKTGAGGASQQFISTLYANYFTEVWYLESGLFYSRANNDAQRIATDLQRYMGSYDSTLYGIWLEYGHALSEKNSNLEPYFRTAYVSGNHDGYTDAGGTNPLTVDDNRTDNWLIELGLRDRRSWELENGMICGLELKAAWQHELLDNAVKANATLLNVGQTPTSPESDRDALALGIQVDLKTSDAVTIGVEYAPTIAGNWYNHSINATLKIDF